VNRPVGVKAGLKLTEEEEARPQIVSRRTFYSLGTLDIDFAQQRANLSRDTGGKNVGSVSKNTDYRCCVKRSGLEM